MNKRGCFKALLLQTPKANEERVVDLQQKVTSLSSKIHLLESERQQTIAGYERALQQINQETQHMRFDYEELVK